jgi:hypothetical protein
MLERQALRGFNQAQHEAGVDVGAKTDVRPTGPGGTDIPRRARPLAVDPARDRRRQR